MDEGSGMVKGRSPKIAAVILLIIGILIVAGPWTVFPVCEHGDSTMACHYTAEAEIIVGSMVALLAILLMLAKRAESLILIGIGEAALGIWTILVPTWLTGLCKSTFMDCRTIGGPMLLLWGVLTILTSLLIVVKGWKDTK